MPREKRSNTTSWDAKKVRDAQAEAATPRRKKKKRFPFGLYLLLVVIISAALAGFGWLLANDLCALDKEPATLVITVEEGDSVKDVAKKLKDGRLIKYKAFFCLMGKFFHASDMIDPGTYELNSDMDYRCLIQAMHDYGVREVVEGVTIPEGTSLQGIIDILVENKVATREGLEDAAANYDFKDYPFLDPAMKGDVRRLEGYLFPDTYDFYMWEEPESALARMLNNFKAKTTDLADEIEASGYSLHDLVTVASLIEKEAGSTDDFGNFASIIYNRLGADWKLQIDATINYIKGTSSLIVTNEDLQIDSPYNTYLYGGLPAGPICSPSLKAIQAAIHPNSTNYWFWYAYQGETYFFTNQDDFNRFVDEHPIEEG
jgi:UPF0755 protein